MDVPRALALIEEMAARGMKLGPEARHSLRKTCRTEVGARWGRKIGEVLRAEKERRRAARQEGLEEP